MSTTPRVAFCQPHMILGGRLQVILSMTYVLNQFGIVPDLLTSSTSFELQDIADHYGDRVKINVRQTPKIPTGHQDLSILLFHNLLRRYVSDYNLLINTSNSLIFLPANANVLSYMFYPRKARIQFDAQDISLPEKHVKLFSPAGLEKLILRTFYRLSYPNSHHHLICMTRFTCRALQQAYPGVPDDLPLVYPAVDSAAFAPQSTNNRLPAIVSIGRFTRSKRQLEQIKLAEHLPKLQFHIIGFVREQSYLQQCEAYIETHNLNNVHLHPNVPHSEMIAIMHRSKYFLHTMINEPFGLTAVQAIAAGCIPIVHDSGGQQETVPVSDLRYQTLTEVPTIINELEKRSPEQVAQLVADLQAHADAHFSAEIFYRQMREIFATILNIEMSDSENGD